MANSSSPAGSSDRSTPPTRLLDARWGDGVRPFILVRHEERLCDFELERRIAFGQRFLEHRGGVQSRARRASQKGSRQESGSVPIRRGLTSVAPPRVKSRLHARVITARALSDCPAAHHSSIDSALQVRGEIRISDFDRGGGRHQPLGGHRTGAAIPALDQRDHALRLGGQDGIIGQRDGSVCESASAKSA